MVNRTVPEHSNNLLGWARRRGVPACLSPIPGNRGPPQVPISLPGLHGDPGGQDRRPALG
ncbi:hypothetical protein KFL01_15850 [Kocuria flava]|uniref:Uncharacterized protein n=1 Tax=Kocuria flava TaxID=446860 RepID=A0ABQ0X8U3_9MICC|nr:hypothetical protein KFL01_15850 [Kocuria flava]